MSIFIKFTYFKHWKLIVSACNTNYKPKIFGDLDKKRNLPSKGRFQSKYLGNEILKIGWQT